MSEFQLYVDSYYASPYAMCAHIALREKELPFEVITMDLAAGNHHKEGYQAKSLTQRVPTLIHNGFCLSESSAICEYLEELYPNNPLYPQDIKSRARARQIQAWLRSDLSAIKEERSTEVVFFQSKKQPLSAKGNIDAQKLFLALDSLLKPGKEFLFEKWSIADVDLAVMIQRLVLNGDTVPDPLIDYAHRQWQRPSVKEWVKWPRPAL